jgi:hypothetical protein
MYRKRPAHPAFYPIVPWGYFLGGKKEGKLQRTTISNLRKRN